MLPRKDFLALVETLRRCLPHELKDREAQALLRWRPPNVFLDEVMSVYVPVSGQPQPAAPMPDADPLPSEPAAPVPDAAPLPPLIGRPFVHDWAAAAGYIVKFIMTHDPKEAKEIVRALKTFFRRQGKVPHRRQLERFAAEALRKSRK